MREGREESNVERERERERIGREERKKKIIFLI